MKKISILGSTGSIGTQALDIIRNNKDKYEVAALSCRSRKELLAEQIIEFRPEVAVCGSAEDAAELQKILGDSTAVRAIEERIGLKRTGDRTGHSDDVMSADSDTCRTEILWGPEGLNEAAVMPCDILLNSLLGISGLEPTYKAIANGTDIALANKETLVAGGSVIMSMVKEKGVKMLPVDSEHSAIFQSLQGNIDRGCRINRILLTASGGPFRGCTREELEEVTLEQALKHPKWDMGAKITIDSSTLMNKGFEVIEARWLFDVPGEKIQVLVHPQSMIHSMVEYEDHSIIAQLGQPDMRIPISYAFEYPGRLPNDYEATDFFSAASQLSFEKPDMEVFRCLGLAYDCLESGGSYPVVLNGANEVLVDLFLHKKIRYIQIQDTLEKILAVHRPERADSIDEILEIDWKARAAALAAVEG